MNSDYYIEEIEVINLPKFGKLIEVSAYPYEDTPFGYCRIVNKGKNFLFPYSLNLLKDLNHKKDIDDFQVNLDNFEYQSGIGYLHFRCLQTPPSKETYNFVDLGVSVLWADRNYGASKPSDFGIMKSYTDVKQENLERNGWRLPTKEEFEELRNLQAKDINSRDNTVIKGNNGNSILLPLAGTASGTNVYRQNQWGDYLGIYSDRKEPKCHFIIEKIGIGMVLNEFDEDSIFSIRFVKDK